jgi:hypothetical protein
MRQTRSYDDGIAYADYAAEFARIVGGSNWVVGVRPTPNILARYGEDVVCLSPQKYADAERIAKLNLTHGYD